MLPYSVCDDDDDDDDEDVRTTACSIQLTVVVAF